MRNGDRGRRRGRPARRRGARPSRPRPRATSSPLLPANENSSDVVSAAFSLRPGDDQDRLRRRVNGDLHVADVVVAVCGAPCRRPFHRRRRPSRWFHRARRRPNPPSPRRSRPCLALRCHRLRWSRCHRFPRSRRRPSPTLRRHRSPPWHFRSRRAGPATRGARPAGRAGRRASGGQPGAEQHARNEAKGEPHAPCGCPAPGGSEAEKAAPQLARIQDGAAVPVPQAPRSQRLAHESQAAVQTASRRWRRAGRSLRAPRTRWSAR